jgi:hypothetical protein
MMSICHVLRDGIARCVFLTAGLGILLLTISPMLAQSDRSERLQERVTSSDERVDVSRAGMPPPINSLAQQALRQACDRVKYATAKLTEARALLAAQKRNHSPSKDHDIKWARAQLVAAQDELNKANAYLRDAREAARLEQR